MQLYIYVCKMSRGTLVVHDEQAKEGLQLMIADKYSKFEMSKHDGLGVVQTRACLTQILRIHPYILCRPTKSPLLSRQKNAHGIPQSWAEVVAQSSGLMEVSGCGFCINFKGVSISVISLIVGFELFKPSIKAGFLSILRWETGNYQMSVWILIGL